VKTRRIVLKVIIGIAAALVLFAIWCVWQLGTNGVGPLRMLAVNRSPVQLAESMQEFREEEFSVLVDGEHVNGLLYVPTSESEHSSVIIISHGFNSPADTMKAKAKSFAAAGIPALVFDFRGGSTISMSDGQSENMTISSEVADLNAVIDHIKISGGFENSDIYLMGESMGGLVTALTASKRTDISALMLCFPAFHCADTARTSFASKDEIPSVVSAMGMNVGRNYWAELYDMDLYKEIEETEIPILIFYGTKDPAVPAQYIEKANETYRQSELFIIEGAGHGFSGDDEKSVLKTCLEFMRVH